MPEWVVISTVRGKDAEHSYPVETCYGPMPDEASADALRERLEVEPVLNNRERVVICWPLTPPPSEG